MSADPQTGPPERERSGRPPEAAEVLARAARVLPEVGRAVLCQIVRAEGSTPGKLGWKMLVTPDGAAYGNLGGGAFEALVVRDAGAKLAMGVVPSAAVRPDTERPDVEEVTGASEVKRYYFTESAVRGEPTGMVCGGLAEVFLEVLAEPPLLVICGGGPVGQAVARAGHLAGFEPLVVEDRAAFREPSAFPPGTVLCDAGRDFRGVPFLSRTAGRGLAGRDLYVTVVSRCWRTDTDALAAVLDQWRDGGTDLRLAYLGLLGSRRKVARVRSELEARGHDLAGVDLRAPIGLPVGGDSPGEIAISILAEVLQIRYRGAARATASSEAVEGAAEAASADPAVSDSALPS